MTTAKTTVATLEVRVATLEALVATLTAAALQPHVGKPMPTNPVPPTGNYPLRDFRGRKYRQEGNVRCFAP